MPGFLDKRRALDAIFLGFRKAIDIPFQQHSCVQIVMLWFGYIGNQTGKKKKKNKKIVGLLDAGGNGEWVILYLDAGNKQSVTEVCPGTNPI